MKAVVLILLLSGSNAFAPSNPIHHPIVAQNHGLHMMSVSTNDEISRRTALTQFVVTTGFLATLSPSIANAAYTPDIKDMKQILFLGLSLDALKKKVADEDTFEAALDGIRTFNKDKNFYPGYAKNFISKTVKNNADGDVRLGYVRKACSILTSLEDLLEGRQGLDGKEASKEAIARVEKAQSLIGKFIADSGVKDEKLDAYVKAHP